MAWKRLQLVHPGGGEYEKGASQDPNGDDEGVKKRRTGEFTTVEVNLFGTYKSKKRAFYFP